MVFSTFQPHPLLRHLIACYWIVEGTDVAKQKIIPDGFTELIFHFGDGYRIQEGESMNLQPISIAAGQLQKPIFLQPTGRSGVLGVKFTPTGMWKLFALDMKLLTNQTLGLKDVISDAHPYQTALSRVTFESVNERLHLAEKNTDRIAIIETFLLRQLKQVRPSVETDLLVSDIVQSGGQVPMHKLLSKYKVSARKMERLFLQQAGIPAKLYSRLVRFTNVFKLLQQPALSRAEISYLAGYFDQAHFNKEFREFTGENPEAYFRQNHTLSNFFLHR